MGAILIIRIQKWGNSLAVLSLLVIMQPYLASHPFGTIEIKRATEKSVTPSCHTEREDEPTYFAFFNSSLSGAAPLLLTDFLTVMSTGVATSP